MKKLTASTFVIGALVLLSAAEMAPGTGVKVGLISDANAIIGRPLTPFSFAGVARRSAYRGAIYGGAAVAAAATTAAVATAAVATAPVYVQPYYAPIAPPPPAGTSLPVGTVVSALPGGCVSAPVNNIEYYLCNGTYYRASFQGNNLVYVVATP